MLKRILGLVPDWTYSFLLKPSFRCSSHFMRLQELFSHSSVERALNAAMLYASRSQLKGDYFEFGVYAGRTFMAAYHLAQTWELDSMKFHAFDSFQGLPEIKGVDAAGFRHFKSGEFACGEDKFRANLVKNDVNLDKVSVFPGFYSSSLNEETKRKLAGRKAAIVYVDCDLYESTRDVLGFMTDFVDEGTVLMFDDWYCFRGHPDRGEAKALREWLEANPSFVTIDYYKYDWHGRAFILQRDVSRHSVI